MSRALLQCELPAELACNVEHDWHGTELSLSLRQCAFLEGATIGLRINTSVCAWRWPDHKNP